MTNEELFKRDKMAKMVGWYDPSQLADTGKKTAISTIVGEYADPRAGAADPTHGKFFDYSVQLKAIPASKKPLDPKEHDDFQTIEKTTREEIWIDYAADVGDGWNSTYAVAYNMAKLTLDAGDVKTERGEILIFGGDGVYPTASTNEYDKRLLKPYEVAFQTAERARAKDETTHSDTEDLKKEPHVFALPGNHDWYDSLMAFKKIFCSPVFNERKFAGFEQSDEDGKVACLEGGWQTRQKRSYFALKLPHDWWLLGVDLQLAHSIDLGQLEYLSSLVEEMDEKSKVILCVPEPYWIRSIKYDKYNLDTIEQKERSIQKLEDFLEKRGAKVKAYIAGDLHHYRRLQDEEQTQKITAGGGGAFLHPTHDFKFWTREEINKYLEDKKIDAPENAEEPEKKKLYFSLEKSYPEQNVSKNLDWKNIWFFLNNPRFGIVTMILYPIVAWLLQGDIVPNNLRPEWITFSGLFNPSFLKEAWLATVNGFIDRALLAIVVLLLLLALILFTDSKSPWYKWIAGFLHGIAHLTAIFFLGWGAFLVCVWITGICSSGTDCKVLELTHQNVIWFLCILIIPAIGGYIIGGIIMGLYLFISLRFFGRHDNEAFSALRIEDYKNFLRMHIDKNGALTIYPFKIEKVSKEWKIEEEPSKDGKPTKCSKKIYCTPDDEKSNAELIEAPIIIP